MTAEEEEGPVFVLPLAVPYFGRGKEFLILRNCISGFLQLFS